MPINHWVNPMARKRTSKTANAARCRRYQERRKQLYGIVPITVSAPLETHEELKRLAKTLCRGNARPC